MITTSKVKKVVSTKPYTGTNGTTIYHNLEMENGDKINIGKKKAQEVGWELTYEIIDSGQEYNKAKSVQKPQEPMQNQSLHSPAPKNEGVQRMIVMQNCIGNSVNYLVGIKSVADEAKIFELAEKMYKEVMKKGAENGSN